MSRHQPCERETIIEMNDEGNGTQISTYQESIHKRLVKLANENPGVIDPADIRKYTDGLSTNVAVPTYWISIRPSKRTNLSEAQKKIIVERLKSTLKKPNN